MKASEIFESTNPVDVITVDVPLMVRLLEFAKEDAKTDMELHVVTENLIRLSTDGKVLSMAHYDDIITQHE